MSLPSSALESSAGFRLEVDSFGRLVLVTAGGERFEGVYPVRCFPFSAPEEFVSFCDERGREVACVEDLRALDAETRALLERELAERELMPVIRRVVAVSSRVESSEWEVETDRGRTRFTLANEDGVRRLGPDGALIVDAHGVRFRIRSLRGLDAHSRRILQRYL